MTSVFEDLEHHGKDRHDHDANRDEREVFLDHRDIAKHETGAHADRDPRDPACNVVEEERSRGHLRRAGDERQERADDRDKAGEDDRLAAVQLEELVGAPDMLGLIIRCEKAGPSPIPSIRGPMPLPTE